GPYSQVCRGFWSDVVGDFSVYVESGGVSFGLFGFSRFYYYCHPRRHIVTKRTAISIDTRVLYEPSVGYNEPVREIQILFVIALPYRCWRDLLLEMLARYQMSSAENRSPFTYVIKVRDRES